MAAPHAIARRNAAAANRTRDAAGRIAVALGIEPLSLRPNARGGAVFNQLSEREAVTEYLERIAGALESQRESGADAPRKGTARTVTKGATDDSERSGEAEPQMAGADHH